MYVFYDTCYDTVLGYPPRGFTALTTLLRRFTTTCDNSRQFTTTHDTFYDTFPRVPTQWFYDTYGKLRQFTTKYDKLRYFYDAFPGYPPLGGHQGWMGELQEEAVSVGLMHSRADGAKCLLTFCQRSRSPNALSVHLRH